MAYDGAQALALLERFAPEIAVLDIGLPVIDVRRSVAAGFERHFVKPLNADHLIAAIDEAE